MSNYIIPDGWNPITEPWEEGRVVNVLYDDGKICWQSYRKAISENQIAWQYPVPLETNTQYVARKGHKLTNIVRRDAANIPLVMVSQSLDNHEVITDLIIKLLESIHDNN